MVWWIGQLRQELLLPSKLVASMLDSRVFDNRGLDSHGSTPRPAPGWRPHFGVRAPLAYNTTFRYESLSSTVLARLRRARTVLRVVQLRC